MKFKILSSEFITSAPSLKEVPKWQLPEIAMVGRSNVGKSSLINFITGRKKLAQTSNTPGKTRLLNFYLINNNFSLVDLPGYGYAKVSKTMQQAWQRNFQAYLKKRQNLILVIQLIDARHGIQESDQQMFAWLEQTGLPVVIVMTKIDKISSNDLAKQIEHTNQILKTDCDQIFSVSALTGKGKDKLLEFLNQYLQEVKPKFFN